MKKFSPGLSKEAMRLFTSDIRATEYFSYVGNMVSVEKAIAVTAILTPDFIEKESCIFWRPNADEYRPEDFPMTGYRRDSFGELTISDRTEDIERYRNNFSISQFFSVWEASEPEAVFKVGLSIEDHKLCYLFAGQVEHYWRIALYRCFPERSFEFEIADDLLDEYGVCLTFWQNSTT